jgi:acetyl-CoA carboxylase beta subunit
MDINKHTIWFKCPNCNFYNPFFFRQSILQDMIICRGCKINIKLNDNMNECKKLKRSLEKVLQKLQKSLTLNINI